jgi:hypothetical protein
MTGVVELIGTGAHRQLRFRSEHPLGRALTDLFNAEANRVISLVDALRESFTTLSPHPTSAWLEGVDNDERGGEDALTLWVVADPKALPVIADALNARIGDIERRFGVQIAVNASSRSEIEQTAPAQAERFADVVLLDGIPPAALVASVRSSAKNLRSHGEHDTRARRLAIAVAAKLERDPSLVRRARARIVDRERQASPGERRELREWLRILDSAPGKLKRLLSDPGERGTRLRQTLPALDLLTPSERQAALASETDQEARTAVTSVTRIKRR